MSRSWHMLLMCGMSCLESVSGLLDTGDRSGVKRVANMLARLMTFGTAFMPVDFAVPTMTV